MNNPIDGAVTPTLHLKILVCGGRNYTDQGKIDTILDGYKRFYGKNMTIIQGGCKGADWEAKRWAIQNGITHKEYPADWNTYGTRAGHIRNQQMLDMEHPDLVIAFPGGRGTQNMINLAKGENFKVQIVK